jgi:hypothetical protein
MIVLALLTALRVASNVGDSNKRIKLMRWRSSALWERCAHSSSAVR